MGHPEFPTFFHRFTTDISHISLPDQFTYPFYYEPHPLSIIASLELQKYLETQQDFSHNFGLNPHDSGLVIGKMFGILVVQHPNGTIGYLRAFSGKLANSNHHEGFVPPLFDMLCEEGFFKQGEQALNELNKRIEALENDPKLHFLKNELQAEEQRSLDELVSLKEAIKQTKADRKEQRKRISESNDAASAELLEALRQESIREQYQLKDLQRFWKFRLFNIHLKLERFQDRINQLKEARKKGSAALQQQLFDAYHFLNQKGETKSLLSIFKNTPLQQPPAGAGECAAPKLLQYAFQHELTPIALAEFWWGASPKSEVRKHGQFYPSCRGKCEPILGHMLQGLDVAPNPMLENPAINKELPIVYEDDYLLLVNKPAEFLSVPGKTIQDSVVTRMKALYPTATGPLIVHRLDMSTSGLMLIAKSQNVYVSLQRQFIKRTVKKRYSALLEDTPVYQHPVIDLPLRVDLEDRPRQLVCYEHGKKAQTCWEIVEKKDGFTKVHFYPITGRTHQLRVHAAHSLGLNTPIVGDDLYGTKADRLYLHAEWLEFEHPITRQRMSVECPADF